MVNPKAKIAAMLGAQAADKAKGIYASPLASLTPPPIRPSSRNATQARASMAVTPSPVAPMMKKGGLVKSKKGHKK